MKWRRRLMFLALGSVAIALAQTWSDYRMNSTQNTFGRQILPNYSQTMRIALDRSETGSFALKALVSLEHCRAEWGRLPKSLGEIAVISEDTFDGNPLRYDAMKRKLWSVGADGVDDGGDFKGNLHFDITGKDYGYIIEHVQPSIPPPLQQARKRG